MPLTVSSPAFAEGERIPNRFSCHGENVSPPLTWDFAPDGTRSFALMMEDPDAPRGTWNHWLVYNLPAEFTGLPTGIRTDQDLPGDARHAKNTRGNAEYTGPCPPVGSTHRYYFIVYALDRMLNLGDSATKEDLKSAMNGHILAEGRLMGTFGK